MMKQCIVLACLLTGTVLSAETLSDCGKSSCRFPFNGTGNSTQERTETLLGNDAVQVSGFGGFHMSSMKINGKQAYFSGFRGAAVFDRTFVLGVSGCSLDYPVRRDDITGAPYQGEYPYVQVHYGGLFTGYNLNPEDLINLSVTATIGGGALYYSDVPDDDDDDDWRIDREAGIEDFFVFEPVVMAHLNVTRWMRVGAGASYRYTKGIDNGKLTNKDFNNWSVIGAVDFGWF